MVCALFLRLFLGATFSTEEIYFFWQKFHELVSKDLIIDFSESCLLGKIVTVTKLKMEKYLKNKENRSMGKITLITDKFRVKKSLFQSNKSPTTYASPILNSMSPNSPGWSHDDSPYSYQIHKRKVSQNNSIEECVASSSRASDETPLKRSGGFVKQRNTLLEDVIMESPKSSVQIAVQRAVNTVEMPLSGDFSKECRLPIINGKHPELYSIAPETVASLLDLNLDCEVLLIDCRYPYEYRAGHIKNAVNIFTKEDVEKKFFDFCVTEERKTSNRLLIFYCEFSSERAPNMMRYIRNLDRGLNEEHYPFVYYPEMYLIDGGYKSFFASFKELCEPQNYIPMLDKEWSADFLYYKGLCRSSSMKLKKK